MWSDRCRIYFKVVAKSPQIHLPGHYELGDAAPKKSIAGGSKKQQRNAEFYGRVSGQVL
jgi:hypothetical protein